MKRAIAVCGFGLVLSLTLNLQVWADEVQTQSYGIQIDVGADGDAATAFPLTCEGVAGVGASGGTTELPVIVFSLVTQTESFRPEMLVGGGILGLKLAQTPAAAFATLPHIDAQRVELVDDLNGDLVQEALIHVLLSDVFDSRDACLNADLLALEVLVSGESGPLRLLGTDAVMPVSEAGAADPIPTLAAAHPFSVHQTFAAMASGTGEVRFAASGVGIEALNVQVFDLSGRRVFDSGVVRGSALSWHGLTSVGVPVANGVYLYVVTVDGIGGQRVRGGVQKLVVVR